MNNARRWSLPLSWFSANCAKSTPWWANTDCSKSHRCFHLSSRDHGYLTAHSRWAVTMDTLLLTAANNANFFRFIGDFIKLTPIIWGCRALWMDKRSANRKQSNNHICHTKHGNLRKRYGNWRRRQDEPLSSHPSAQISNRVRCFLESTIGVL